jgi:murein L,D-transpeptidase YafK
MRPQRQHGTGGGLGAVATVITGLLLSGCGVFDRSHAAPAATPTAASQASDDDSHLEWAENEEYFVIVRKACRTLDVFRHGYRIRSFPAVFGVAGPGRKLYEGDLRTPTGLYMIIDKRSHPRWRKFLLLDYPNLEDRHRYWLAMEADRIPERGDRYASPGGAIGIHGTDRPEANRRGEDWTFGCISIDNPDIEDLAALVPIGTLVLIED